VVVVYGAMRNFMMAGDLSAHVALDTLAPAHLYGLGVAEGLNGELLILDGQAITTTRARDSDRPDTRTTLGLQGRAALLVTSRVARWFPPVDVPIAVQGLTDLERFVARAARRAGLDTTRALAFRLTGSPKWVTWHVMDWPRPAAEHTLTNHKQYAVTGHFAGQPVELLGFFSHNHKAFFTHHTRESHLHVRPAGQPFVAHVDSLALAPGMTLLLPATAR
jgi:acetolactate decarboxylase